LFTGSQGNNISGENATKHTNSEKIDAAHETVTQHEAHRPIHNVETTKRQKRTTTNATELDSVQRRFERLVAIWFGILSINFVYEGPDHAYTGVIEYVENFWVDT